MLWYLDCLVHSPFVWDSSGSWSHFFSLILPFIPTMCVYGILKITHGEVERTPETKTLDRSCRNFKRSPWVLFHPSNTVSLYKIKTVLYKTILNPFYTLALPVLKSSCEAYILNACPCIHTLNTHSEFTMLCFYSPTAGPYGKTTVGASCEGEGWGGGCVCWFSPQSALFLRAWAALKPLTEPKALLLLPFQRETHEGNNRQTHSLPLRGKCIFTSPGASFTEPGVVSRAQRQASLQRKPLPTS